MSGCFMKQAVRIAVLLLLTRSALAWGPHSEIGVAAGRALATNDPFLAYIANDINALGSVSWMGDWANGAEITGVQGTRIYTRDVFDFPGFKPPLPSNTGHGDATSGSYTALFHRVLQAMRTETPWNTLCWLGSLLHDTEDTGAPPHAAQIYGPLHSPMETWLDASQISITGYTPVALGATEEAATAGYVLRMNALHDLAVAKAAEIVPLIESNDRPSAEVLILHCALESARATADTLHTLGALQAQMTPPANSGGLSGRIQTAPDAEQLTAKIMLSGTTFSTLAQVNGDYAFRNLPAGPYTLVAMMPGYTPQSVAVSVVANTQTTQNVSLAASGNLLRNGGLTVRWGDPVVPDGWYQVSQGGILYWRSEPVFAAPGQAFRLTVDWKSGVEAEATLLWTGKAWDTNTMLRAPALSRVFEAPGDLTQMSRAVVYVRAAGDLTNTVASVSLTPVSTSIDLDIGVNNPTPLAPASLVVTNHGNGVSLVWTRSPDDGAGSDDIVNYRIYRRPAGGIFTERSTVAAGTTNAFDIGGLLDGSNYEYMVRAVDGVQESGALHFDGVNDYVNVTHHASLDLGGGPFTVEGWIRLAPGTPLSTDTHSYPIAFKGSYTGAYYIFGVRGGGYNGLYLRVFETSSQQMQPTVNKSSVFLDYQWHHVCAVRDASTNGYLYIDGTQAGNFPNWRGNPNRVNNLLIGTEANTVRFFPGLIDEVKLYTRGLSAAEVLDSYSSGATPTNGLIAWWKLNAASGSSATNETGVNSGTLVNFPPGPWTIGRRGNTASLTHVFTSRGTVILVH